MHLEVRIPYRLEKLRAFLAVLLLSAPVAAQSTDRTAVAREAFETGYEKVQDGDLEGAITAFKRAFELSPHYSVLYNLAQAYAASGRIVRAIDTFQRYLDLGGDVVPEARRRQVLDAISYHSRRVGALDLQIAPAGAKVLLDGEFIGEAPLSSPVRASAGTHALVVEASGYTTAVQSVTVLGQRTLQVEVRLEPAPATARYAVHCATPDVEASVDGRRVALSAGSSELVLPSGAHRFTFHRSGYTPHVVVATAAPGTRAEVQCELRVDPKSEGLAELRVRHPVATKATINGSPVPRGRLPPGRHELTVAGPEFEPSRQFITLRPGERRTVTVVPPWTSTARARHDVEAESTRHTIAYVTAGVGVTALAAAAALYIYDNQAYDDWQKKNRALVARLRSEPETVTPRQLDDLLTEENSIRNRDTVAVGLGVLGVALCAGGVALRLWPSEPHAPRLTTSLRELRFTSAF